MGSSYNHRADNKLRTIMARVDLRSKNKNKSKQNQNHYEY